MKVSDSHIKFKLSLALTIFVTTFLSAQLSRTHYIPPITTAANSNATPQNQYLHISTPSIAPVNVEVNDLGNVISNYTVSNANPLEIYLGFGDDTSFVVPSSNIESEISNKGFIIQSEKPVYVSVRLVAGNQNQAGSLVSKGLSGLGNVFRVGTFTNLKNFTSSNQDFINFVSVMATENNTQIDFSDLPSDIVIENSIPLMGVLNAGESKIIALNPAITPSNRDGLIGALVTSNKPIIVNCGSFNGSNSNGNGRDAGIDQIAPLQTISVDGQVHSEYIFVRGNGYDDIERPLIVAHYDDTEVWIDGDSSSGNLIAVLNAGEYISIDGSNFSTQSLSGSNPGGNLYVWTSKTTFAFQGIGGTNNEANQEMFFVPPLSCKAPNTINNIPIIQSSGSGDVNFVGGITVVAESGASLLVNGIPTVAIPQSVLGNSNYETYLISGLTGNISVSSDGQIYVSYYGANGAAALGGFYSGFVFKPEITANPIGLNTEELCIPFIELSLGGEEVFDAYQWLYNGEVINGANSETFVPVNPGYYQLEGIISDCTTVISDNIPVSACAGDYDNDGVNNNLDTDLDNDGILNIDEYNCDFVFDLSTEPGILFNSNVLVSDSNSFISPFEGFSDQTMLLGASPTVGTIQSSSTYQLTFDQPTKFKVEQASDFYTIGHMDDMEQYIIRVPSDQTITVSNPDNQLLIDINYDGVYDNNISEFTGFEIRFKLNLAELLTGAGTFSFQSLNATQFDIEYINISETESNQAAFQFTEICRTVDNDGDLIFDIFDLDSDNDGIFDITESGNSLLDENQNGTVDNLNFNDLDNNGHHDNAQNLLDSDSDLVYDYLDLDSDNDGLYDLFESGVGFNIQDLDNNGQIDLGFNDGNSNGVSDTAELIIPLDSDIDGQPDFIELDSDFDGCFDVDEAGFNGTLGILDGSDIDINGLIVGGNGYLIPVDSNQDGLFDYQEFIEILPASLISPQFVCENSDISLEVVLEPDSDLFDQINWELSMDGGNSWNELTDSTTGFQGFSTNILQVVNVQIDLSNSFFRAKMSRNDLICKTVYSSEIELIVNPLPAILPNVSLYQCDQDTDGITIFNLLESNSLISENYQQETFTYYHSLSDAQQGSNNFITDPLIYQNQSSDHSVNPDQIFVRVESADGCSLVSQLDLFVSTTQIPENFTIPPYNECYNDFDGITIFDFSDSEGMILDIFPPTQSLTVTYYESELDALSEVNSIVNISAFENSSGQNQNIWVRIDSDIDNSCVGLGPYVQLIVDPIPVSIVPINSYFCVESFENLTLNLSDEFDSNILGNLSALDFSINYFSNIFDAENNLFSINSISNTNNIQNLFYKITDLNTGCYDIIEFDIQFVDIPTLYPISDFEVCDDNNDGVFLFDTSNFEDTLIGSQTNMTVIYLDEFDNPLQDADGILVNSPFPNLFLSESQTIKAIVSNGFCEDAVYEIDFFVNNNTDFFVDDEIICDGDSVFAQVYPQDPISPYIYEWVMPDFSLITTLDPTLEVSTTGSYQVTVKNLNDSCSTTQDFEVFQSEPPTITLNDVTIVEGTSNNSISIDEFNLGNANYEFQLVHENGNIIFPYQDEGYFDQLTGGFYSLFVRDELQCAEVSIIVPVFYVPNFFTPNGDGYNDYWGIKGIISSDYIYSKISIFDRYGKLLENMDLNQNLWDGRYNGSHLPTNDYWYSIELIKSDGTIFNSKGHFTLRR